MLTVDILSFDELTDIEKKSFMLPDNGSGRDYASYLAVREDGITIRLESSAMEPEDVSFWRDLKWVKDAILEAYDLGIERGTEMPGYGETVSKI